MVELRVVESQVAIQTTTSHLNHIPKDLFDLSNTEGIDSFVSAFRQGKLVQDMASDDEDSSDGEA